MFKCPKLKPLYRHTMKGAMIRTGRKDITEGTTTANTLTTARLFCSDSGRVCFPFVVWAGLCCQRNLIRPPRQASIIMKRKHSVTQIKIITSDSPACKPARNQETKTLKSRTVIKTLFDYHSIHIILEFDNGATVAPVFSLIRFCIFVNIYQWRHRSRRWHTTPEKTRPFGTPTSLISGTAEVSPPPRSAQYTYRSAAADSQPGWI